MIELQSPGLYKKRGWGMIANETTITNHEKSFHTF